MRKKIVAGNWKMNTNVKDGVELASALNNELKNVTLDNNSKVIIAPPSTHLTIVNQVIDKNKIQLAAQNCSSEASGAFTGEVSAEMLKNLGCDAVILGHSERRAYYHETSDILLKKLKLVLTNQMTPIFCCGESLAQREKGTHFNTVVQQISEVLFTLDSDEFSNVVIAYEPVWAIGTGVTASDEQAQEMHEYIRKVVETKYGNDIANNLSILYGGSVNAGNAKELFAQNDVDGGLVGGASLKVDNFIDIIKAV